MNLAEYQVAAARTMANVDVTQHMLNAALGLCGEAAEVAQSVHWSDDLLGECGDLLWYVAQMCKAYGDTIANIPPNDNIKNEDQALDMLWRSTGYIADATKKKMFHMREVNLLVFFDSLQEVVTSVNALLKFHGFTLEDACKHNIAKLLKRYPDGFSSERSINRSE